MNVDLPKAKTLEGHLFSSEKIKCMQTTKTCKAATHCFAIQKFASELCNFTLNYESTCVKLNDGNSGSVSAIALLF